MFKKENRFTFKGKLPQNTFVSPLFIVRFEKSQKLEVAIVVSKKIDKRATVRNNIRRRIYHALEGQQSLLYHLVFYTKKPITSATPEALSREIERLLGFIPNK